MKEEVRENKKMKEEGREKKKMKTTEGRKLRIIYVCEREVALQFSIN